MTIKEFCKSRSNCSKCPYSSICKPIAEELIPEDYNLEIDDLVTNAIIDTAEALRPKPKTGHWIYDKSIENWRCSECNETPKTMGYCGSANFMAKHFKFCNHCGVRMIES